MRNAKHSQHLFRGDPPRRFWHFAGQTDLCWEWAGDRFNNGYGRIKVDGKAVLAHRYAYELAFGSIPAGVFVLHRCDNPACVRPSHLFLGSHTDNMRDMLSKGRGVFPKGSHHGNAKLSESDVTSMRQRHAGGESCASLGQEFGIGRGTVHRIVTGRAWRHVQVGAP